MMRQGQVIWIFATGSTLVTPALGTPSSRVLTNCTGTASGLTAGTASVATTVALQTMKARMKIMLSYLLLVEM